MLFQYKVRLFVLTTVVSATAAPAALADTGVYAGLTGGRSQFHFSQRDGDALVIADWNARPDSFTYVIDSSSIHQSDFAFSAVVGYRFMPELSLEASYTDLGAPDYRSTGILTYNPFPEISLAHESPYNTARRIHSLHRCR